MKTPENRLGILENKAPPSGRQFVFWQGEPWTLEQKAAAIRQNREQRVFWRSLLAGEERGTEGDQRERFPAEALGRGGEREGCRGHEPADGTLLAYAPHAAQMEIHRAREKRFRMVCTGRRFGKTLGLAAELLDRGGSEQGGDYAWVAPTYNVAERGIEAFRMIGEGFVKVTGQSPRKIEFTGAAGPVRVWFLTADNPDNIRGFGFQGLVIDEAATIAPDVWHYVLRPTIAQTLGWAVLVSTPKGRNWFYDLFTRGLDPAETDYKSFTFPSNASPFFPAREWEEARRIMHENAFRQEYMAEFMEDSAGVFRGVDGCLVLETGNWKLETPRQVVIGCDVAKHTDFTVLIAMDADTGRCFAMERFNHLDWTIQKERIVGFCRKWRGRLILDATGVGDPIYDDLRRVLPEIEAVVLTTRTKEHLIQELAHAVEERKVTWPGGTRSQNGDERSTPNAQLTTSNGHWEALTAEMKRYEYDLRPGGGISYGAPSGYHDDCVIALALASHRRSEMMPYVGKMYVLRGGNRTPSDGGYESEGRRGRRLFARRSRCVM